jgi:predicted nucleic acid-binding protein
VDTSVVVAGFASWHDGHGAAAEALSRGPRLPSHVALECLSVLTRLPPPHRVGAQLVRDFLEARFPGPYLGLPEDGYRSPVADCVAFGLRGGAVYDGLIAATARHFGATLLTRDARAVRVYEAFGVDFEPIA